MELTSQEKLFGSGPSTVISLLKSLNNYKYTTLFCDNYFTSISLFEYLLDNMYFLATGTFRKNRIDKCPLKTDKILESEGRGSFDFNT